MQSCLLCCAPSEAVLDLLGLLWRQHPLCILQRPCWRTMPGCRPLSWCMTRADSTQHTAHWHTPPTGSDVRPPCPLLRSPRGAFRPR